MINPCADNVEKKFGVKNLLARLSKKIDFRKEVLDSNLVCFGLKKIGRSQARCTKNFRRLSGSINPENDFFKNKN